MSLEIKGNLENVKMEEILDYEKSPEHDFPFLHGTAMGISIKAEENTSKETPCCDLCKLQFKFQKDYENHYRQRHKSLFPYRCRVCGKCYYLKKSLTKHSVKIHSESSANHKRKSVRCLICDAEFGGVTKLEEHARKQNPGEDAIICDKCGMKFRKSRTFRNHDVKEHTWISIFKLMEHGMTIRCSLCDAQLEDLMKLKDHVSKHHSVIKIMKREGNSENVEFIENFEDENTGKVIEYVPSPKNVRLNAKLSKDDVQYCDICNLHFKSDKIFKNHCVQQHGIISPYLCLVCAKQYHSRQGLRYHLQNYHPDVLIDPKRCKSVRCSICDTEFKGVTKLEEHVLKQHPGERAMVCHECGVKFKKLRTLQKHRAKEHAYRNFCDRFLVTSEDAFIHRGKCRTKYLQIRKEDNTKGKMVSLESFSTPPTHCKLCNENFVYYTHYKEHHDQYHPEVNFMSCEHCGINLSSYGNWKRHVMTYHQDVNAGYLQPKKTRNLIFECDYCQGEFVGITNYELHGRDNHPGLNLFHCTHCTQGFKTRRTMVLHVQGIHGMNGKFCIFCGKRYSAMQEMTRHMKICKKGNLKRVSGTGYFCTICRTMLLVKKNSFNRHVSICAQYEKCAMCERRFHKNNRQQMEHHMNIRHSGMISNYTPDTSGACRFKVENVDGIESFYEPYFSVKEEFSNES